MAGKTTISNKEQRINALQVQRSTYGIVIPVGWGTVRGPAFLMWFGDFTAIAHTEKNSQGGKGGQVNSTSTTYTYEGSLILGAAEGLVSSIRTVWRDKSVFRDGATTALQQAGLSLMTGAAGQAVWSHLTTNHPTEAISYSEIAYLYATGYELASGASLSNHSFEMVFPIKVSGKDDANPKDILTDVLTNARYGVPGWGAGLIGDLTVFGDYCLAAGILLSPFLDAQRPAQEFLAELMRITNCEVVWSDGLLNVVPYGDAALSGNGATYTPSLAPQYDLTDDDYLDDDEPVRIDTKRQADAWNICQVEFLDRTHDYNVAVVSADDLALIDAYGKRKRQPDKFHAICEPSIARLVVQQVLQREAYIRQTYYFTIPEKYVRLDPMDLVTLTDSRLGLDRELVRLVKIDEDDEGNLVCEAEQMLVGTAQAAIYGSTGGTGYIGNYDVAPGSIAVPVVFNPPTTLTAGQKEVWAAVASTSAAWGGCEVWASFDGTNYERVGSITGPARYGVLTATLPSVADPDTTSVLKVNLTISGGALLPAATADADRDATLCLVGTELISYRDAVLTSAFNYDLDYLRRGRFATPISSKGSGTTFVRLDDAIFKLPYFNTQEGATVRLKFLSFNVYGRAKESLADVPFYTVTPLLTQGVGVGVSGLTVTPISIPGANAETQPGLSMTWTTITEPEAVGVLLEYRVKTPAGNVTQKEQPITPGVAATAVAGGVVGQVLYEARGAILYEPTRGAPVFSAWATASAVTPPFVAGGVPSTGVIGGDFEPIDEWPSNPPNPN